MSFRIGPDCDGCGICALACPRGAIHPVDLVDAGGDGSRTVLTYSITGLECNDCRMCTIVCPQFTVEYDPAWAVCWGRGCPLTSSRYEGWSCTEGLRRCSCGSSLWKRPGDKVWLCARCDLDSKVMCPKARKASTLDES